MTARICCCTVRAIWPQITTASTSILKIPCATYAKKIGASKLAKAAAAAGAAQGRKYLDVETDPEKLTRFVVGANIYKEGVDPELKADSEYPVWLWQLRTDRKPPPLEDLDPNTYYYWKRVRKLQKKETLRLLKTKYKYM